MANRSVLTAGVLVLLARCSVPPAEQESPRVIPMTRVIHIPAVSAADRSALAEASPSRLTTMPGAEDELPQGPAGFDVLDDGTIVLADPLRKRLYYAATDGAFDRERSLAFEASSVTVRPQGQMELRSAVSDELYLLDAAGQPRRLSPNEATSIAEPMDVVELVGPNQAIVRTSSVGGISRSPEIVIQFERAEERLLSARSLGADSQGSTYVALETTRGGPTVSVSKLIRKYSADGTLTAQILDISLDYYVHPVDEFRLRGGIVYQLVPKEQEVLIRVWDTN